MYSDPANEHMDISANLHIQIHESIRKLIALQSHRWYLSKKCKLRDQQWRHNVFPRQVVFWRECLLALAIGTGRKGQIITFKYFSQLITTKVFKIQSLNVILMFGLEGILGVFKRMRKFIQLCDKGVLRLFSVFYSSNVQTPLSQFLHLTFLQRCQNFREQPRKKVRIFSCENSYRKSLLYE